MGYKALFACGIGFCPAVFVSDCGIGACPAVHEGDDGDLLVIGKKVAAVPDELNGKIGPDETIVKIPRSVLIGAALKLGK